MQRLKTQSKSVDIHSGPLILVNEAHAFISANDPLLLDTIDLRYPDICVERNTARLLKQLLPDGKSCGIVPVSGHRSIPEQQQIWDETVAQSGLSFARIYVALPGHSEHHTGLAIDLGWQSEDSELDFIRPAFPYDGACGEFRKAALRFGFVERYAQGKEAITGIGHEPWHFRYVGFPHSVIMQSNGLCLEEYIERVRGYSEANPLCYYTGDYKIEIWFVQSEQYPPPHPDGYTQISGNNVDGFIVTKWSTLYD